MYRRAACQSTLAAVSGPVACAVACAVVRACTFVRDGDMVSLVCVLVALSMVVGVVLRK